MKATYKKTHFISDGVRVLEYYDEKTGVYTWTLQTEMFGNWYNAKDGEIKSYTNVPNCAI